MSSPEEVQTCDGECSVSGKCDPTHPLHCGHFSITRRTQIQRAIYAYSMCLKCGKRSKVKTRVETLRDCAI